MTIQDDDTDNEEETGGKSGDTAGESEEEEHWYEDSELADQGRGIFTEADREWLVGLREYDSPQHDSNVRTRIVERIQNTLADLQLLTELDDTTRTRIYDEQSAAEVEEYLSNLIEFSYRGVRGEIQVIENSVESGVYRGEVAYGNKYCTVSTDIDIKHGPNPKRAKEALERGEYGRLTTRDIGLLVRAGELDADDLEQLDFLIDIDTLYDDEE